LRGKNEPTNSLTGYTTGIELSLSAYSPKDTYPIGDITPLDIVEPEPLVVVLPTITEVGIA